MCLLFFIPLALSLVLSVSWYPRPRLCGITVHVVPVPLSLPLIASRILLWSGQQLHSRSVSIATMMTSRVLMTLTREGKTVTGCQTLTRSPRVYLVMVANWLRAYCIIEWSESYLLPGRDRNDVFQRRAGVEGHDYLTLVRMKHG